MKTQKQLCLEALRKANARHVAIMDAINCRENPLTKNDLEVLIAKFPSRYGQYAGILENLKA